MKRLTFADPAEVRAWLAGLRVSFDDMDAVVADMMRPLRRRNLGPVLHAEHYNAARAQFLQALDFAGPPEEQGPAPDDDRPPWETGGGT